MEPLSLGEHMRPALAPPAVLVRRGSPPLAIRQRQEAEVRRLHDERQRHVATLRLGTRELFASRPERAMRRSPGAANLARLVLLKIERRGGLVFIWLNSYEGGDECRAVVRKLRSDALKAYRARVRAAFKVVASRRGSPPPAIRATVREFRGHSKNMELNVLALMHAPRSEGVTRRRSRAASARFP